MNPSVLPRAPKPVDTAPVITRSRAHTYRPSSTKTHLFLQSSESSSARRTIDISENSFSTKATVGSISPDPAALERLLHVLREFDPKAAKHYGIESRQLECLYYAVVEHLSLVEIAERMTILAHTADTHLYQATRGFDVPSHKKRKTLAAAYWLQAGRDEAARA